MRFTIDEEKLLQANAIGLGTWAVGLAEGKIVDDMLFSQKSSGPMMQHGSIMAASMAGMSVISAKADRSTRKKMLKLSGATWGACAAANLYNMQKGTQKRDPAIVMAVGTAAMAALNLAAGFSKSGGLV